MKCRDCGKELPKPDKYGLCATCGVARLINVIAFPDKPKKRKKAK